MKVTTALGALGLAAVFAMTGIGQTVNVGMLKFNGIGLRSTYGQVVKALGKPAKDGKPTNEECAGGKEKTIEYSGLSITFMDAVSKNKKTFEVIGFEVTSPKYVVSGIKVGDSELTVRRRLGTKFTKEADESSSNVWTYEFPDQDSPGFTTIKFKRGKVVEIASNFMVC